MISLEQALKATRDDRIASLDLRAFGEGDVLNLILQRSEIIRDLPRPNMYIRRWTEGEDGPLRDLIHRLGAGEIIRRAAAFIYLEFLELKPILDRAPPRRIADIGCGYALFDLFAAQDFGCDLVLIDLEENDLRHFGYQGEGAAYSNLRVARRFLTDNGLNDAVIATVNPKSDRLDGFRDLDYVVSFISCGFHYPWETYRDFFEAALREDGALILDLRRRTSRAAQGNLSALGRVEVIDEAADGSADRIMVIRRR
jgi:SAM-dependent methyltransferase